MLNLFNNTNNLSLLDNNLLSYGLILGSVAILGYSIYHFTVIINSNINKDIPNLLDNETITQNIVNNLKAQPITGQDTVVTKLSNEILESLYNTEVKQLTDSSVQTDPNMLYEYLKELIYNNATPTTSLGEISPTDFINEYRNNPEYASYFQNTAKWSESIGDPRLFKSGSSEYNFLTKLR
jgi:hypothetical protein